MIGKMKAEFKGKVISEAVELKSNIYALVDVNGDENKKKKRDNKIAVKNTKHEEFVDVLFNKEVIRHKIKRIQSKLYRIGTYDVCKISLTWYDDEMWCNFYLLYFFYSNSFFHI